MLAESLSERTIEHRVETMTRFARLGLDILEADAEAIASFLAEHRADWRSAHTRSNYYRVLKAWFTWLLRTGRRGDNPLDLIKAPHVPRSRPRPCTDTELGRVLNVCNRRRTFGMVVLASCQGMRVHEVAQMRGEYLREERLRVLGKGGSDEWIPAHELLLEIAPLFPQRGWWFPNYLGDGGHVTWQSVSEVVGNAFRRADVDPGAHRLRHWYGTNVLKSSGGNVRVAQRLLRHADLSSTAIYTDVDDAALIAAVRSLPVPLRRVS